MYIDGVYVGNNEDAGTGAASSADLAGVYINAPFLMGMEDKR